MSDDSRTPVVGPLAAQRALTRELATTREVLQRANHLLAILILEVGFGIIAGAVYWLTH